jgi:glycosyltransferase involved in cell wall biosynthesis
VSPLSKEVMQPFLPPESKIYDISNPIDVIQAPPVDVARNDYFVMVGRLSASKGPILLADAARVSQTRIRFIGDGELRQQLESEYPEAEVTGWLSQTEVQKYLSQARALVFASRWYEAQGLVILEAAGRGIPTVVADVCAGRDSISNGVTGLLFRGGDMSDLANKISSLKDDTKVSQLGRAAYDRYWKNPTTLEKHVDQLEACYVNMMETVAR